ncbi:FAS1 domain-containing protein [Pilobolus umbonatus]|nr:FAS1 domain-containing protein [Pilobolus umbonatus]
MLLSFIILLLTSVCMAQQYSFDVHDYQQGPQSLFDKIAPDTSLSTFMDILTRETDIFHLFNNTDSVPFTVFCPTNAAFKSELTAYTREHLHEFIQYHIVPTQKMDSHVLKKSHSLKTLLDNKTIQVKRNIITGRITLNDHAVVNVAHPIEAINGIAYKIDHLLRSMDIPA